MPEHITLGVIPIPVSMDVDFMSIWFPEIVEKYGYKLATITYTPYGYSPFVEIFENQVCLNATGKWISPLKTHISQCKWTGARCLVHWNLRDLSRFQSQCTLVWRCGSKICQMGPL